MVMPAFHLGFKKVVDPVIAVLLLIALSPVFVAVAIAVFLSLGRPVFFIQIRPGLHEKPFRLVKFRSMRPSVGDKNARDEERLGVFGRVLRKASLDEIPGLWNAVVGDMSFVGPRPLLMEYLPLYSARHRTRHNVKPGMTGLAQVRGRNSLGWAQKLDLDVEYVDKHSFMLDASILVRTVPLVARGSGVTAKNGDTMMRLQENYDSV